MTTTRKKWVMLAGFALLLFCSTVMTFAVTGQSAAGTDTVRSPKPQPSRHSPGDEFEVPPPPFSEDIFPCSECHADMEVNSQRRQLEEEHTNIVLKHDEDHRWCLDCHNPDDRDKLRLASGELIDFTESYKLCGQCHGDKYRDWRAGVHGKRSGYWNGKKKYLLCAHCHNPHSPRFKPIEPKPPPKPPAPPR